MIEAREAGTIFFEREDKEFQQAWVFLNRAGYVCDDYMLMFSDRTPSGALIHSFKNRATRRYITIEVPKGNI